MRILSEHELLHDRPDSRFDDLDLVSWTKHPEHGTWGYYASFRIGAEWISAGEQLIVTPKRAIGNIDFLKMFMTCFSSEHAADSFSRIYSLKVDEDPIEAPALTSVLSPLIVIHFLNVVRRIKSLKKGYRTVDENLRKVKGRIRSLANERENIAVGRYDRIHCVYEEYTEDIPENRLLKKALLFAKKVIAGFNHHSSGYSKALNLVNQALALFRNVSPEVDVRSVRLVRGHKLYSQYKEAIRLAKIVLLYFDYSINRTSQERTKVIPFVLDMSLLYEHYVYGLLHEAYGQKIKYQFSSRTGVPDFLFVSEGFKAILDTKYIPKYKALPTETYIIRQLSGYSRDLRILNELGYSGLTENGPLPATPCIVIYPVESPGSEPENPFIGKNLQSLAKIERGLSNFYRIPLPVPMLKSN